MTFLTSLSSDKGETPDLAPLKMKVLYRVCGLCEQEH